MSERARALEQAQSGANVLTRCQCGGNLRWGQMVSAGVYAIYCDACTAPAVDPPPSGASPQATGGYIHHSLTDWIPTPECDCDRCTSARKSARKPTGGASPQAETSANVRALTVHICEDCLNLRGEMCNEPCCRFCRRTMAEVADYLDALLIRPRIDGVSVLVDEGSPLSAPNSPPETSDLHLRSFDIVQAWLSECQKPGCHPCFECSAKLHAIVKGLLANQPAPVSPVEPTPEPPTDQLRETPMGHRIFRHVCGTPEDDGECMACSQIDCPDGEPLHYHHDGCPCCSQKPTVEPEPPTNPPCARCGHALSAHRPEFGACDGRERPCACPEYQVPTVEPEPPTLEPCAHELDYHNCAECVGPKVEPEPCVWREDEDGIWETSCGASWVFTDGSPSENNTKFCHNCGHPVQPVAYVERFEDDEDEAGAPLKVEREQSDEQPSEISAVPHKPVVNLMEALKKSLESLDRARKP